MEKKTLLEARITQYLQKHISALGPIKWQRHGKGSGLITIKNLKVYSFSWGKQRFSLDFDIDYTEVEPPTYTWGRSKQYLGRKRNDEIRSHFQWCQNELSTITKVLNVTNVNIKSIKLKKKK